MQKICWGRFDPDENAVVPRGRAAVVIKWLLMLDGTMEFTWTFYGLVYEDFAV